MYSIMYLRALPMGSASALALKSAYLRLGFMPEVNICMNIFIKDFELN